MCRFTVLAIYFLFYEQTVFSTRVDQRQTGDLNVQIDLKNLQIVGLTKGKEEYVEYDYAYDYSEMTIKPPNGTTTKKPLNITEPAISNKDNTTFSTTTVFADQTTSSMANESLTDITTISSINGLKEDSSATAIPQDSVGNSTSNDCKKGFFRNSKGNCELKLQNPSNALLQMIKQKSKLIMNNGVWQP